MSAKDGRQEFRVVIDGADLPRDAVDRINRAVQNAAAIEIAKLDLKGDWHLHIPPWNWGIWYRPLSPEQLELAGLQIPKELFQER